MERFRGLEAVERPKNHLEKLRGLVRDISAAINLEAQNEHGVKGLLNADGSVSMDGFLIANGGIYRPEQIAEDHKIDYKSEISHALANRTDDPEKQKKIVAQWRESRGKSKANQIEMAIMVLFYKILKTEFVVARSAAHDDYQGGMDIFLVDKETGQTLCAIDGVHTDDSGIPGRDPNRGKAEKVKKKAERGGARVKYGLTLQEGRLTRSGLKNVPVFYLGMTSDEFGELAKNMSPNPSAAITQAERQIFSGMVKFLAEQKTVLSALDLKPEIKANLDRLDPTLARLSQIAAPAGAEFLRQAA
jgi:hypothetical protein